MNAPTVHDPCRHCGAEQRGNPIPEEVLRANAAVRGQEWDGAPDYYSNTIMVEIPGVYDGGLFFACPFCGGRWHRWKPGTYQHERAVRFVNEADTEIFLVLRTPDGAHTREARVRTNSYVDARDDGTLAEFLASHIDGLDGTVLVTEPGHLGGGTIEVVLDGPT